MLRKTSRLFALVLLCGVVQAALSMRADEPVKTGEKRDTLLYVRTDPPGARVLLNGKELGTSNGLFQVEPGTGTILVELEGRKPDQRQVIIRANGVTRLELQLKPQAKAEGEADVGKAAKPENVPQKAVPVTLGVKFFKNGDSITITEVKATSPDLKAGDKVIVKGHYALSSKATASLCLFTTATTGSGKSAIRPEQRTGVTKGQGEFELSSTLDCDGYLHVTFYSVPQGQPFGGLYFGTAKQMKEIEHWDLRSRYTAE
ncbi:MAG: PEGA domain-containing protein [Thermoguttaceae bacterium]